MLPLLLALQMVTDSGATYSGMARQLAVAVPRLQAEARVDGVLDEPPWREAARLVGFSQYRPVDGRPAEDSTEVLVWYAPDAIWFGIRAFEPHGKVVRATLADRDNIDADDRVEILLDTYLDHRLGLRGRGAHPLQQPPLPERRPAGLGPAGRARRPALGLRGHMDPRRAR